ncbi:MAG: hypothetical protein O2880_15275 [Proteobacteria bacterium]|nr:hypothetical protein [Pseudomonadota bacterium]
MGLVCVGSAGFAATLAAKQKNRGKVEAMSKDGRLTVLLKSDVKEIRPNSVVISLGDEIIEIPNDAVIVSAGGILPTTFLQKIGIKVETKWGSE